jgi:hypothetical protein
MEAGGQVQEPQVPAQHVVTCTGEELVGSTAEQFCLTVKWGQIPKSSVPRVGLIGTKVSRQSMKHK